MGQLIQNAIKTPDGTILVSRNRHDYKQYVDKNGQTYMIDGGLDYVRRSENLGAIDLTVYDDEPFEFIRLKYLRGGRGKNGDQPLTYITIANMDDDYLLEAIKYNADRGHGESIANIMYAKELAYRQQKQLQEDSLETECHTCQKEEIMGNGKKFEHKLTGKVFVNIHPGVYTENGVLKGSGVEKILPSWLVEHSSEWKEIHELTVALGTQFKTGSEKTVYTIDSVEDNNVVVSWQAGRHRSTRTFPIKTVNDMFKDRYWVVERKALFTTDDGVEMFEGDSWFYVNLNKLNLRPRKTGNMEYKGDQPAEILTFSTMEAADEYTFLNRPMLTLTDIADNILNLSNLREIALKRYNG